MLTIIALEGSPLSTRGELTRWFMEIKPNVFVGNVNARIRNLLWNRLIRSGKVRAGVILYASNNEQGYAMSMFGEPKREVIECEGLQLIRIRNEF